MLIGLLSLQSVSVAQNKKSKVKIKPNLKPEVVMIDSAKCREEHYPAVAKCAHLPGNPVNNAVRQNVIEQVMNLRDLEPILHKKYVDGEILIVGGVYDIHTGKVEFLQETLLNLPNAKK